MKLPSINSKQVAPTTPATKFDIRRGVLDDSKIMLMATWSKPTPHPRGGWFRIGVPTVTFWRAWKIRRKAIFAAKIRPIKTAEGMRLEWRKETAFAPETVETPTPSAKMPSRAVQGPRKGVRLRQLKGLLPHQPVAIARHMLALEAFGGSLEASTTGVGKTYIALGVARELGLRPMIVCPKNIISGWEEAAEALGVKPIFVSNYEQLKAGNNPYVDPWGRADHKNGTVNWTPPNKRVMTIFDEAHRLKNQSSQNSQLAIGCRMAGIPTMQLSATIAQDVTEMYTTGLLIGLHKGGTDFHRWAADYGCQFDGMGLVWKGKAEDIEELHRMLFPMHGSRIRGQDLPGFPNLLVIPKSLDCEDMESLQAVYENMAIEMDLHMAKREADGMKALNALCAMTRARQHAELLKVPMIVGLAQDLVAEGNSVPIFVNYSDTLEALRDRLGLGTVHLIRGGQTKKERDFNVAQFQKDESRILLCQIQAGGESISLHDRHGNYPRASIISPGFDARAVIQACGRTPRAGGKSKCVVYIVFAHGTIEDAACRCVQRKAGNIELLNDGDLADGFLSRIVPTLKK